MQSVWRSHQLFLLAVKALQPVSPLEENEGTLSTPAAFGSLHNSHKIYLKHAYLRADMDAGCLALGSVASASLLRLMTVARVILYAEPCCCPSQMML